MAVKCLLENHSNEWDSRVSSDSLGINLSFEPISAEAPGEDVVGELPAASEAPKKKGKKGKKGKKVKGKKNKGKNKGKKKNKKSQQMSATDFIQNHLPVEIPDGSVGRFGQVKATATVIIFRLSRDRTANPD